MQIPIYLDNHATTRCDPAVLEAMWPWFAEKYGNPASRTHRFGLEANAAVEHARGEVAALIGASPKEIVFTSGATEADNLAILGLARARPDRPHLVTGATEHPAVLDAMSALEREGRTVTRLGVDGDGRVEPDQVRRAIRPDTALVSLMAVNNEIGAIHPLAEVGAICRAAGVPLHVDAAQAGAAVPLDVAAIQADLVSLSAHKMYGPKGIGALWVRRGRPRLVLEPLQYGGGHERGLRSGTLPTPLVVGFGVAARLAKEGLALGEPARVGALRDRLWAGLQAISSVHLNGGLAHRVPTNLNVSIEGVESQALLASLRDVALSSGSACSSATLEPSHVLRAIGVPPALANGSVRFGLGRFTTAEEIDYVIARVSETVPRLRALADGGFPDGR
jgi:cysteine desulfurase